jgi:hypothetical protein
VLATEWDRFNAYDLFNVKPSGVSGPVGPGLERSTGPGIMNSIPKPWHPDNPMFWFGVLLLVTFGAVGASTSFRAGPFSGSIGAGKS